MSDIRRVYLTGHDEEVLLYDSGGPFVIVPWEEWEKLQAVVDAARPFPPLLERINEALGPLYSLAYAHGFQYDGPTWKVELEALVAALRALDGEL